MDGEVKDHPLGNCWHVDLTSAGRPRVLAVSLVIDRVTHAASVLTEGIDGGIVVEET
jgi:hypothetical protein